MEEYLFLDWLLEFMVWGIFHRDGTVTLVVGLVIMGPKSKLQHTFRNVLALPKAVN
jgi:hypothetical protein